MSIYKTKSNDIAKKERLIYISLQNGMDEEEEIIYQDENKDISLLFEKIDDQINNLKGNLNQPNQNFASALVFINNATSNKDFLEILVQNKEDQVQEIFACILNFLNQKSRNIDLNIPAIHLLSNLLSFPNLLIMQNISAIYGIFDYFTNQFFSILSEDYLPIVWECLYLMNSLFSLIIRKFKNPDSPHSAVCISEIPEEYQEMIKSFVVKIKQIILIENVNLNLLRAALKSATFLYEEDFYIYQYFVKADFVNLCFQIMLKLNPAFIEASELLGWLAMNDEPTINSFPPDYPQIFLSFFINKPDEIIESTIKLIDKLSLSSYFLQKMIGMPGFLHILLSLDQSYNIRISSLHLFNSLIKYHITYIEKFLEDESIYDLFIDFIDTDHSEIIKSVFEIICSITTCVEHMDRIPIYFNKLIQSEGLMTRINNIKEEDINEEITEMAFLATSQIEDIIQTKQIAPC